MKYEMIFGDEKLFDGAPKDAEAVTCVDGFNKLYYKFFGHRVYISMPSDLVWQLRMGEITHCTMTAMRRLIKEPKRWTVEDQKAGRLPDVGAELLHESEGYVNFVGEFDFRWMLRTKEGGLHLAEKFYCSPIETPEEKAERLRSEWRIKALSSASILSGMQEYELKRLGGYIGDIYDALLSGDLTMPSKDGE